MKLRVPSWLLTTTLAATASLATVACQPRATQQPVVSAAQTPRAHPADAYPAATRLGEDCRFFAVSDDIETLFDAVGRDEIAARFAEGWEQATYEVVREIGMNPLSLEGLADIGIDTQAEVGLAVVGDRRPVGVVFLHLRSPERFKTFLYRELRERPRVFEGVVMVGERDGTLAVDGDLAMLFVGPGAREAAQRATLVEPEASLSRKRSFRVAMRQMKGAPLVRGWMDPRGLAYLATGLDPRWPGASYGAAARAVEEAEREALATARAGGATAEELVALDDMFAEAQGDLRGDREAKLVRRLVGDLGGAAMAFELGAEGWRLKVLLDAPESSAVKGMWGEPGAGARLLAALDRAPLGMMALNLDLGSMQPLAYLLGVEMDDADEAFAELGLGALDELVTGELAVAVLAPEAGLGAANLDRVTVAAQLGVASDEAARKALDAIANRVGGPLAREEGGWRLAPPDLPQLSLRLKDGQLLASSDEALMKRLLAGERGGYQPDGPARLLTRSGVVGAVTFAAGLPVLLETRGSAMWMPESAVSHPREADVPPSEEYTKKLAEIEVVNAQIAAQIQAAERERVKRLSEAVEPLGEVAAVLRTTPHGLELDLRHQTRGATLIELAVDWLTLAQPVDVVSSSRLEMLYARRAKLEAELHEIHERDAQDANKRSGSP